MKFSLSSATRGVRASLWGVSLAAAVLVSTPAVAQTVLKIGWPTPDSPTDSYAIGGHRLKAQIEKALGGKVEVQLYPNRQLGDEKQLLEGLRFGTVDMGLVTNAVVATVEPAFQVFDLPFVFSSEEQALKVIDGPVSETLAAKLDAKGVVVLGYLGGGFRQMINNKKPVLVPDDVKGVKYRVLPSPLFLSMFSNLGGAAVPMPWGETFTAVQQGTIDGLEATAAILESGKFYEVAKYLSLTNHMYGTAPVLISKRTLAKFTPVEQAAIKTAAKAAIAEQRVVNSANTSKLVDSMKSKGLAVNAVPDAAPFRKLMTPIYEKAKETVGAAVVDQVLNSAAK